MSPGKSQHTVPRFYLRPFLSPGWVYQRGLRKPRRVQSPKNVASTDWYYTAKNDLQERTLDGLNTRLETRAAPILRKLVTSDSPVSNAERRLLSIFIANLFLRAPDTIQAIGSSLLRGIEELDQKMERLVVHMNLQIDDSSPFVRMGSKADSPIWTKRQWKDKLHSFREEAQKGKPMIATVMSSVRTVADAIYDMTWMVATAPRGSFFVTSDAPVGLTTLEGSRIGVGWGNPNACATFPLSPNRFLMLIHRRPSTWAFATFSEASVLVSNARTTVLAADAVYSPQPYMFAAEWLGGPVS